MGAEAEQRARYGTLLRHLDERQRRLVAAADAERLGRGGVSTVARTSGLSRPTIHQGLRELHEEPLAAGRTRRAGGGRKRIEAVDPSIGDQLECLIDPATRGDPMSPLRWTSKSTRHLATALAKAIMVMRAPREMPAGQFKARCLEIMDEVAATGEPVIVTKRGKAVAQLAPIARKP